ncbi:MAG: hypothetical protein ACO32I_01195 [Candidatus Limnocylindrus sp.]|jgi:hypothetical protein
MLTLPVKIAALNTRHNFHAGRVEYHLEILLLGKKFSLAVNEEFVASLEHAADPSAQIAQPDPEPRARRPLPRARAAQQQTHDIDDEDMPHGYSVGGVERAAEDYTLEEMENL